jgi:hypothetical protein
MNRADAQGWLNRYVAAWLSYDPNDIAALFTKGIVYRYRPLLRDAFRYRRAMPRVHRVLHPASVITGSRGDRRHDQ